MRHELNTPLEMLKRLVYVLYVGCLFIGFLFGIMGLLGGHSDALVAATILAGSATFLRYIGVRRLEFARLALSFPMGGPGDTLSKETRTQFENLISAFHANEDWANRQAIRHRIATLVRQHPPLIDVFGKAIAEVHPNLYHSATYRKDL
jgi:hypothetical protein